MSAGNTRRIVACLLVLAALAVLPYLGGARHAFVYDDHGQIADNPFLESAGRWSAVLSLQTVNDGAIVNGRRPAVLLSYLADRAVWDLNPVGWRSTNYLIHGCATLLLYLLIIRVVRRVEPEHPRNLFAFVAALLFAWHPALVESVHVPSFRADLLVALFGLLALHGALGCRAGASPVRNGLHAAWAWVAMGGAILSKESGVVAPFLIAWCWVCFPALRPSRRMMISVVLGGLGLVVMFIVLCARPDPEGMSPPSLQAIGAEWNGRSLLYPYNLFTLPWLWWSYLRILLLPIPLIVDRVIEPVQSLGTWRFVGGSLVLLVSIGCGWAAVRRGYTWIGFGIGVLLLGFAPVSNLVPLLNPMAERYMPLMVMGFAVVVSWCLAGAGLRAGPWTAGRTAVLAVVLVGYFVVGTLRIQEFRDDESLWQRTLRDEPRSARAHTWMGLSMQRQGRLPEAVEYFGKAHVLNPYDLTPLINHAILYGRLGELERAERMLREAIAIRPSFAPAHWNLAMTLQFQGRLDEALEVVSETLRLDPYHVEARKARIVLWVNQGRYEEALHDAEHLLLLVPDDPEARAARSYLFERARQ